MLYICNVNTNQKNQDTMTKREKIEAAIIYAGYHGEETMALRLYVENRISYDKFRDLFRSGKKRKENGEPCGCFHCNNK